MMYFIGTVLAGFAIWGIVTAIGLFRLRRWARYSILIIGGLVAFFGLVSMLSMLAATMVSLTPLPGATPSPLAPDQAHSVQVMTKVIFVVLALMYGGICSIGVWWLVYFNRKTARETFAGRIEELVVAGIPVTASIAVPGRRPILISVIAVLNLIGAGCILLSVFLPIPALAFGFVLHGWGKLAIYVLYCCLQTAVGVGLWRMQEWGRRLTFGLLALGLVQSAFYALQPSLVLRYSAEINKLISPVPSPLPARFQSILFSASFGFSILFCVAIAAVLIHYRRAFRPIVPPPDESAAA